MDLDAIKQAVQNYVEKYRHPELPRLELSQLYALFPEEESLPECVAFGWPDRWPNSSRKGVYFVFGRGGRLLYIGKASMNNSMGGRLGGWFHTEKGSGRCQVVGHWTEKPMYIATLPVADDMTFEASALEEYLIQSLSPPDNVRGRRHQTET